MTSHAWSSVCVLAVVFAVQSTVSFAQAPSNATKDTTQSLPQGPPRIGNATATKNKVEGVVGSTTHTISVGTDVYTNELVRTGDASVADLKFLDDTSLSVGPISEIRLDKFVYDPNGSNGAVVIEATRGAFRFVTGKQDQRVYQIKTPFGTLGVRG
jgi:hypothetical protein